MSELLTIYYSGFWDVPHAFYTEFNENLFLFWRDEFDNEIDDYPSEYKVYKITSTSLENAIEPSDYSPVAVNMKFIPSFQENDLVGIVSIQDLKFDKTKRKFIDSEVFNSLISP